MLLPQSWVLSANDASTPFPLSNLPYGVFSTAKLSPRCGVAIGDQVLDIRSCEAAGLIKLSPQPIFDQPHWNKLMALDSRHWQRFRDLITSLLQADSSHQQDLQDKLIPLSEVGLHMPFEVREFTDLCAIGYSPAAFGTKFNYGANTSPVGTNRGGHASAVVISGTPIRRPNCSEPVAEYECGDFAPRAKLSVSYELGAVVGGSSAMGRSIGSEQADAMIFGYALLSKWSARAGQNWCERLFSERSWAKPFATVLSPWIVSAAAFASFQIAYPKLGREPSSAKQSPNPISHDINITTEIQLEDGSASVFSGIHYHDVHYCPAQQLACHVASGHAVNSGDLIGLSSISTLERRLQSALPELGCNSAGFMEQHNSDTSYYIEDGDTLSITGTVLNSDLRIGFGNCYNKVLPAARLPRLVYKPSIVHCYYRYG